MDAEHIPTSPVKEQEDYSVEKLSDRLWRLSNLYFVENKAGKVVKFQPNFVQSLLLANLHPRNIILKARQLGMSTFIAILFLDESLFRSNRKSAIVADKDTSAKNIFSKMDFAWRNLPPRLKKALGLELVTDSASKMEFSNGSSVTVGTTIHSGTYQNLHLSEYGPLCASSPEKAEVVVKSAFPTVPDIEDSMIFIESTAEGEGNDFWQRCVDAQEALEKANAKGQSLHPLQYRFHFFPWWINPEYEVDPASLGGPQNISSSTQRYCDELEETLGIRIPSNKRAWYDLKQRENKDRMKEQYPSFPEEAFLSSGNKLFNAEILKVKLQQETRAPLHVDGDLSIFAYYQRGHRYALGADVAQGVGRDSSTMAIIDFTTNEVVATYHSNRIDPVSFAHEIARVGNMYGTCLVAPEANNVGHTTTVTLLQIYPNIYSYEIKGYLEDKETERIGWLSNVQTKPRMMYDLADAFQADESPLICPDAAVLREALAYQKDDALNTTVRMASANSRSTRHFDLLIATAIAWQMNAHASTTYGTSDPKTKQKIQSNRSRERTFA